MGNRRLVQFSGGLVILAGIALAVVRFFGELAPRQNLEGAVAGAAFGSVIAAPGILALLSLRQRPALVLPAAAILVPMSMMSFALVTLPLLIPAYLLARSFARTAGVTQMRSAVRVMASTVLVFGLLVAAFAALFAHEDPREYVTGSGGVGTSDVVTYWEVALAFMFCGLAIGLGWWSSPKVAARVSQPGDDMVSASA